MAGETMSWADMSQFVNWSPDGGPGGCPAPNPEPPTTSEPGDEWD
jgi:hypothetical protein